MRSISLHPASLVCGLAFGLVCFLTMGQATTISPSALGSTVRVEYMPHPRDYVQIRQGTPYVVPPGKLFVLTGLGNNGVTGIGLLDLWVDGQQEVVAGATFSGGSTGTAMADLSSVAPVPPGFTVPGGSTIQVDPTHSATTARAWGYLAPQ